MKRKFWLIVLTVFIMPVFSASLEELIGAEQAAALRDASEPITAVQVKAPKLQLQPRHGELNAAVTEIFNKLEPGITVETLSLYKNPSAAGWDNAKQTSLLNQLVALSTLAGIQYYSASRKTMRTFYETSAIIDSPAAKNPLPDPVYTELPASLLLYARQKDLTFGDNIYSYSFYTGGDYIYFVQENLSAMNSGIIPAIGKNKLHSLIAFIDAGDSLLIYAVSMAKVVSFPGMGDRIGASFSNRAIAVLKWFEENRK